LSAIGIFSERVDDPDLTEVNCCSKSSGFGVARDELDVLDTATVGDGDGRNDGACVQGPETEGVGMLDAKRRLEDGDWDDEIRSQEDVLLEVDRQPVRRELLLKDIKGTGG
jgi:hypothetical protein